MAKRPRLSSMSVSELMQEIKTRRRRLPSLERRREKLLAKLADLDGVIAQLGGSTGPSERRRGGGKNGSLRAYLQRALKGKTLTVGEATEAVRKLGYRSRSPRFRVVVNSELSDKKGGFNRVARGQYTLP